MNKAQIIAELPKLKAAEREQVFRRLCELQDEDLLRGAGPSEEERKMLDQALAEYEADRNPGLPWRKAMRQIRNSTTR